MCFSWVTRHKYQHEQSRTYEQISNIKLAYSGTNILVEYDEDLIPSGINISDENGIVEISGTPFLLTLIILLGLKFGVGECEDITKLLH